MCVCVGEVRVGSLFDPVGSGSQNQVAGKAYMASTFICWFVWLILAFLFTMLFSLEKVVFRFQCKKSVKKNYTWPHSYYVHNQMIRTCILRIKLSTEHIFHSFTLPATQPVPCVLGCNPCYKFRMDAESDTKGAHNIFSSSTNVLVPTPTPLL